MPFGEELFAGVGGRTTAQGYATDSIRQKFTGYERDFESRLDFAEARYYASQQGRFTSIDPLMASASALNPQTFNRYSYTLNSPCKFTDPSGMLSTEMTSACGGGCHNGEGSLLNSSKGGSIGASNFGVFEEFSIFNALAQKG